MAICVLNGTTFGDVWSNKGDFISTKVQHLELLEHYYWTPNYMAYRWAVPELNLQGRMLESCPGPSSIGIPTHQPLCQHPHPHFRYNHPAHQSRCHCSCCTISLCLICYLSAHFLPYWPLPTVCLNDPQCLPYWLPQCLPCWPLPTAYLTGPCCIPLH